MTIYNKLKERFEILNNFIDDSRLLDSANNILYLITECFKSGNKLLICGNGGSAADSQHIAAEFIVKLKSYRKPLPAIALSSDISIITATANDFSYSNIFERQIDGIGEDGDILIGLSTSGNSMNIIRAIECAKRKNIKTIAVTGNATSRIYYLADYKLLFDKADTQAVQELYMMIFHIIIEEIESKL